MNRAEEFAFSWALLDAASVFLAEQSHVQLCVRIGAGEYRETITELLERFSCADMAIPPALSASLWAWINGFVGSDAETPLRNLASRIRVSASGWTPSSDAQSRAVPRSAAKAT